MARPLRIQFPNAVYHVTCRGNEKRDIFLDNHDRKRFLELLQKSLEIYHVILYAYVLMGNHFHLLVETPLGNLSEFMRHFNITYTSWFNRNYNRSGHLYQGRFKGILVERESYLTVLSRYIHLNPIRTSEWDAKGLIEKERYLRAYRWSSLPGYIQKGERQEWVNYDLVLSEYGGDNEEGMRNYWNAIRSEIGLPNTSLKREIVGQSLLGSRGFVKWVRENFLGDKVSDRELPQVRRIQGYLAVDDILDVISEETGKTREDILFKRSRVRQMAMEFLYRFGGLKGSEIGRLMGLDYSTVSQGRKRFRNYLEKDEEIKRLVARIEGKLSIKKI